jgi:bacterioferritin
MADPDRAVALLNRILEQELAGVVRYTHYSLMVFGYNRIPIVEWLRAQASESLLHAQEAGELITLLGGYPSLAIGPLLDSHQHDIGAILRESLQAEGEALVLYKELLALVKDQSVVLEEYARKQIAIEELHAGAVDKMLRQAGAVAAYRTATA